MKKPSLVFLSLFLLALVVASFFIIRKTRESFNNAITCPRGSWCPNGTTSGKFFLCPPGTFGEREGLTSSTCSGRCNAGCVCAAGSVNPCPKKCPAGFYCVVGTTNDGTVPPIVCPAGNYCPEGSSQPTRCPEGKYCPEGTERI